MGWDFESAGDNNKVEFTKLPEGVTKIRLVDDEPNVRWVHWMNVNRRSATCPGKGCPICEIRAIQKANKEPYSYPVSRRFALQIINRNTGKLEILEQGITFFQDLKELKDILNEKGKKLTNVDISVRRRGMGKDDTSYRLDIDEEYAYTEEDVKLIEEQMLNLDEYFVAPTPEQITKVIGGADWDETMYPKDDEEGGEEEFELK